MDLSRPICGDNEIAITFADHINTPAFIYNCVVDCVRSPGRCNYSISSECGVKISCQVKAGNQRLSRIAYIRSANYNNFSIPNKHAFESWENEPKIIL